MSKYSKYAKPTSVNPKSAQPIGPERTPDVVGSNLNAENVSQVKRVKADEIKSSGDKVTKFCDYGIGIEEAPKRSGGNRNNN